MTTIQQKLSDIVAAHLVKIIFFSFALTITIAFLIGSSFPKISDLLMKIGPVIFGLGIFTGLTRTKFYTDFFQRVIFNVFYHPSENNKPNELTEKWKVLTNAILKNVAEKFHDNGTNEIFSRYLDIKTDYHYSDLDITFNIELKDEDIVEITQTIKNKIIANKTCDKIAMEQVFSSYKDHDNGFIVKEILINGVPYENSKVPIKEKNTTTLTIDIDTSIQKEVIVERTYLHRQNIAQDPIFTQEYVRFVHGINIKYKAKKCKVHIYKIGYNTMIDEKDIYKDSSGFYRVPLSSSDELTLPGQGYMLVITPKKVLST